MGLELDEQTIGGIDVSGWSAEDKDELRALIAMETAARAEEESALKKSPSEVIADKRRDAEKAKRDAADAAALRAAEKQYGADLIGTIRTRMGLVIMKPVTKTEDDAFNKRYREAKDRDEAQGEFVWNSTMREQCCYPSQDRLALMVKEIARLEDSLTNMYAGLAHGLDDRLLGK